MGHAIHANTRHAGRMTRPRYRLPKRRDLYVLVMQHGTLHLHWVPGAGIHVLAVNQYGRDKPLYKYDRTKQGTPYMQRRQVKPVDGTTFPGASRTSIVLAKFPVLLAQASVTAYNDGSARQPGWFTIRTRGKLWEITAKEPDGACSLTVQDASLDAALLTLEKLLTAEDAPWETDPFLLKRVPKGRKK